MKYSKYIKEMTRTEFFLRSVWSELPMYPRGFLDYTTRILKLLMLFGMATGGTTIIPATAYAFHDKSLTFETMIVPVSLIGISFLSLISYPITSWISNLIHGKDYQRCDPLEINIPNTP